MVWFTEPKARRTDWETQREIFDPLNEEFSFVLDVCATAENAKCERFFSPEQNGLAQKWSGMCWMNPPFGSVIGHWVYKAWESACEGDCTVVSILPVRSNNEWWKYVIQGEVRFLRKKPQFVGADGDTMFPCAVVIWHAHLDPGNVMKVWDWKLTKSNYRELGLGPIPTSLTREKES